MTSPAPKTLLECWLGSRAELCIAAIELDRPAWTSGGFGGRSGPEHNVATRQDKLDMPTVHLAHQFFEQLAVDADNLRRVGDRMVR
jgi:hypothetical protein